MQPHSALLSLTWLGYSRCALSTRTSTTALLMRCKPQLHSSSTQKGKISQTSITTLFTPSSKSQHIGQSASHAASSSKTAHTRKHGELEGGFSPEAAPLKCPRVTVSSRLQSVAPLAERLRPRTLDEFVGQPSLTESGWLIMCHVDGGAMGSIIL